MPSPVRYPAGVVNRAPDHPLASLPFPDPTRFQVFWDDFHSFTVSGAGLYGWHKDEINTGALDPTVQDAAGGVIRFTIDNADGDNANFQWALNTTVLEPFKVVPGKRAWLRVKFKTEDADTDIPHVGMHVAADDVAGTEPSDQFLFRSLRADPDALQFACGKTNSTEVSISLGDLADDTWVVCTAYYDGKNTITAWRESEDGTITHQGQASVTSATAGDLLPDTEMTVAFGMEGTDTGADDMSLDFIFIAIER